MFFCFKAPTMNTHTRNTLLALSAMVLGISSCAPAAESRTTGWRTDGTGRYPAARPPTTWGPDQNVIWASPMSSWSNATPVIVGGRIFNCAEPTTLVCLRLSDGQLLWEKNNSYDDALGPGHDLNMPKTHGHNGYSSSTPVTDGKRIYAVFGNGVVACYDLDGNRHWIKMHEAPVEGWGHSASPVLVDGKLILKLKDLAALDPASGEVLWRQTVKHSFGSPIAARVGDLDVIITPSGSLLHPDDGRELANCDIHLEYNAPIVDGDIVYFITSKKGIAARMAATADGNLALENLWQTSLPGDRFYASPVYHDGLIYAITRGQRFTVIDATDGNVVRDEKLDLSKAGGGNSVYSSPTLAGDQLYLFGLDGSALVIDPGPTGKIVARNAIEETRSCPVFLDTRMYLRGMSKLYCIGQDER